MSIQIQFVLDVDDPSSVVGCALVDCNTPEQQAL